MVEKDKIWYPCFQQDVFRESEPKGKSGTFECDELWDYMIPYINEGRSEEKQVVDWREYIDQWGTEYLREIR